MTDWKNILVLDRAAKKPLAKQFAEGVGSAIRKGRCHPNEKLPTIHEWVRLLGVSEWVPRKGLALLAKERLIVVKKHVGAVVIGGEDHAPKGRVLYVSVDHGNLYSRNVMAFSMGQAFAAAGYRFQHVSVPADGTDENDLARLNDALWDGVDFAVFDGFRRSREITAMFVERGIPYLVDRDDGALSGGKVTTLESMYSQLVDELVDRLAASGARRVVHVGYGLWLGDLLTSRLCTRGMLSERMKMAPVKGEVTVESFQRAAMEEFQHRLAKGRKWLPDVFVFADDHVAAGALLAMTAAGVRIPEDVRVIVRTNKGACPVYLKPLTCIETDYEQRGVAIARYIIARLNGKTPEKPVLSMKFIRGRTF